MKELFTALAKVWPEKITVDWRRFSSGHWRVPEGDISAAYCADTFPKIKVFTHERALFTNCGGHYSGPVAASAKCYPLLPPDGLHHEEQRYTYEGLDARFQGKLFQLGREVVFTATDASVDDWRTLFRSMYADGGYFASQPHYRLFLADERWTRHGPNASEALALEQALIEQGNRLHFSKEDMARFLDNAQVPTISETPQNLQLAFL